MPGEDAERREDHADHKRHKQICERAALPWTHCARPRKVRDKRLELAVRSGRQGHPQAMVELLGEEASIDGCLVKALRNQVAVGLGRS